MKKLVIISLGFAISVSSFAQISIGKHDTHDSAILELESKSQGFLLPRMTNAERLAIKDPAQGLQVFVTDFREGTIMFYEADKWKAFTQLGSRPNAPTEVQASVVTNASGEVEITFTPPSDNGGSDIISYKVTPILGGVTGTPTEVDASGTEVYASGNASTKVTGLAIGKSYTFTVKATNAIGTSLPSEASNSITTPPQ
ncbi:MAG: fibronectin type III domain-containing protein [Polaribacter sp.]|jgi:hypothetical protein|nr:fibronectin type III domain-containing protein [Polaribacter sp.]